MPHAVTRRAVRSSPGRHPLLALGLALPVVYFAIQLIAAAFYPGYSFLNRDASTLGSHGSTAPWIFNGGALVVGAIELVLAVAFLGALLKARIGILLPALLSLALVSAALGSLNAFLHPLPDPRHTEGVLSILGSGLIFLPLLSIAVLWRLGARAVALTLVALGLAVIPLMTGLVQRLCMHAGLDFSGYQAFLNGYHGLIQRLGALMLFGSIAAVAHVLQRSQAAGAGRAAVPPGR